MKVLYHASCTDGSGAALAAWMHLGDTRDNGEVIEYIPVQYGNEPPEINEGENIFIVDFSYPRSVIEKMSMKASRIVIIDHHKTAEQDLSEPFENAQCEIDINFDMGMSGPVLTWAYFTLAEVPALLLYIQDRDLWRWELDDTADIIKGLSLNEDWREWQMFIDKPELLKQLKIGGAAINRYLYIKADEITDTWPTYWNIEQETVPLYNLPGYMLSDTLHMALEKYPECSYAVGYFDFPEKRIYSLRSRKDSDVDVSEIAKKHGGGGHKHAAGFSVERKVE